MGQQTGQRKPKVTDVSNRLRIFIVGCPRSGTTLLQGLIHTHPDTISFTESHFFDFGFKRPRNGPFYYIAQVAPSLVHTFLEDNRVSPIIDEALLKSMPSLPGIPGLGLRNWGQYFIRIFDEVAYSHGKHIWIEKTPEHVRRIELIERYLPGAVFIHIIRDGPDTVASLVRASKAWNYPMDIRMAVKRYNTNLTFSWRRLQKGKDQFVHYDQLTQDPVKAIRSLFRRLNLTYDPAWQESYRERVRPLIAPEEDWKASATGDISRRSTFTETFGDRERQLVMDELDHKLYDNLLARL